jgi:hypothetical protein
MEEATPRLSLPFPAPRIEFCHTLQGAEKQEGNNFCTPLTLCPLVRHLPPSPEGGAYFWGRKTDTFYRIGGWRTAVGTGAREWNGNPWAISPQAVNIF